MKYFIILIIFSALPCFAAKSEQGYLLSTELSFKDGKRTIQTANIQIFAKDLNGWVTS